MPSLNSPLSLLLYAHIAAILRYFFKTREMCELLKIKRNCTWIFIHSHIFYSHTFLLTLQKNFILQANYKKAWKYRFYKCLKGPDMRSAMTNICFLPPPSPLPGVRHRTAPECRLSDPGFGQTWSLWKICRQWLFLQFYGKAIRSLKEHLGGFYVNIWNHY